MFGHHTQDSGLRKIQNEKMKQDDVLKNLNVYAFLNNVDPPVEESREAAFSIKFIKNCGREQGN